MNKEDDKQDEDQNKYYVGGNSRGGGGSGLSVVGPPDDDENDVESVFGRASAQSSAPQGGPTNICRITVYRNGFIIGEGGEFRPFSDEANNKMWKDMRDGHVPAELQAQLTSPQGVMDVHLNDKRAEDYTPPAYVAYGGSGQSLGGASEADTDAVVAQSDDLETPVVDESQPKVVIQVRLHSGKRMRVTLNSHHTIRHIQALIQAEGAGASPYTLMAGYPPAKITDMNQSVGEAKLNGTQVVQKLA